MVSSLLTVSSHTPFICFTGDEEESDRFQDVVLGPPGRLDLRADVDPRAEHPYEGEGSHVHRTHRPNGRTMGASPALAVTMANPVACTSFGGVTRDSSVLRASCKEDLVTCYLQQDHVLEAAPWQVSTVRFSSASLHHNNRNIATTHISNQASHRTCSSSSSPSCGTSMRPSEFRAVIGPSADTAVARAIERCGV